MMAATRNNGNFPMGVWVNTGSCKKWMVNRVYDVMGNGEELVQELTPNIKSAYLDGYVTTCGDMCFRIVLCISHDAECTYLF